MGQQPSLEMQDTNISSNIDRDSLLVQNGNSHEFQLSGNYGLRQVSYAATTHNPTGFSLPNSNQYHHLHIVKCLMLHLHAPREDQKKVNYITTNTKSITSITCKCCR